MVWDPDRETEGDVIFAGAALRPAAFTCLLTRCCGHSTVPCAPEILDRLEIPLVAGEGDRQSTRPTSPPTWRRLGAGVSAAERTATVRRLANPAATPGGFLRPGHVFPLAARPMPAERASHTEATVALCQAAGLAPVGVCCEVMNFDGTMAGRQTWKPRHCAGAFRWSISPIYGLGYEPPRSRHAATTGSQPRAFACDRPG